MILYSHSRYGVFQVTTDVYGPHGWVLKEQAYEIIGETSDTYITRVFETKTPMWDEFGRYEAWYTTSVGIHKSRFVRWHITQLKIF